MPLPEIATGAASVSDADHHEHFLLSFSQQEAQRRNAVMPATFSAELLAAHRKKLENVRSFNPRYAAATKVNVAGICKKWQDYCEKVGLDKWKEALKTISRETMMDFVLFLCDECKIRSSGSSKQYIRQFQQLFRVVTGNYVNRNVMDELYNYHNHVLVPTFRLRPPNIDDKHVVSVDELRVILTFNIAYDQTVFPGERHRIQLSCCYLLLSYTGARPAELVHGERKAPKDGTAAHLFGSSLVMTDSSDAVDQLSSAGDLPDHACHDETSHRLDALLHAETVGRGRPKALCYEDITLYIVRHPVTGRTMPVMAIKFVHHKGSDNRPKPTIFFFTPTKKLIFCVVSLIIALALHDEAFAAPSLTDATRVLDVKTWGSMKCTTLRWKDSKLKTPIFRRIGRNGDLSPNEAMHYSKLRYDMSQQSLNAGYEQPWTPRAFRRGAGNAANGKASNDVRDQIMRHDPRFATFHGHYLNQKVQFDLQNTFLGEETQDELYRMLVHVSLTRDPRARKKMVPREVWKNLPPDPETSRLEQRRKDLKQGQYRIEGRDTEAEVIRLSKRIHSSKSRFQERVHEAYHDYWFQNRPTWDIESQNRGDESAFEYEEPSIAQGIPEREQLAKLWCYEPEDLTDEMTMQQRIKSIDLIRSLCDQRETDKRRRIRNLGTEKALAEKKPPLTQAQPGSDVPGVFPLLMDPNQCPDCLGNERLQADERHFRYCRPQIRNDHFDDHHLHEREMAAQSGASNMCKAAACMGLEFKDVDNFRDHVHRVHGIRLRSASRAEKRREKKARRRALAHRPGLLSM